MDDWTGTLLSQYANSPIILGMIERINDAVDPSSLIEVFYNKIWNIDTAEDYGLDIWGRIVGVPRVLSVDAGDYFGFAEAGVKVWEPFGQGQFYSGTPTTANYRLSNDAYRTLILLKATANINGCTVPSLNTALMKVFPNQGNAYALDLGGMAMRFNFEFLLNNYQRAVFIQSGIFPHPTGVQVRYMEIEGGCRFGFAEMGAPGAAPFGFGTFFGGVTSEI